jgi:ABC-type nitrate/sulfonate/bicarbonate transport system permease component
MNRSLAGADWSARAIQAAFLVVLLALWDFVTQNGIVSPIFLPPLRLVATKFWQVLQTSTLYANLWVTVVEVLGAVAIAYALGLSIGYLVGRSRYAVTVFEPLFAGLFAIPIIIFLPLFILFFGIDIESKIAFGATYAFFPVVLNTIGGIAGVDPRFVTVARSMGATEAQLFRRVLFPAALPVIVTGLRMGCIVAFLSILGSEQIAGLRGLGTRIVRLGEGMNTAEMFAYIVFVILMALVLNITLTRVQRRFSRGREEA